MVLPDANTEPPKFQYSTVEGCFLQDEPSTNASTFDYTSNNFGLTYDIDAEQDLNHQRTQWERFNHHISSLNRQSAAKVQYKLIYLVCNCHDFLMQYS